MRLLKPIVHEQVKDKKREQRFFALDEYQVPKEQSKSSSNRGVPWLSR